MTITNLATHPIRYLTVQELAEYLRLNERTIYYHIDKGALPAVRIGDSIRIRVEDARMYAGENRPVNGDR